MALLKSISIADLTAKNATSQAQRAAEKAAAQEPATDQTPTTTTDQPKR